MNVLLSGALAAAPAAMNADGRMGLGEAIVFIVVALVSVACGIGVLTAKRAVTAAINMIGIMISLAVLYIVNESPFMGITQIVVYTGAVMTLVLFVIMLVGVGGDDEQDGGQLHGDDVVLVERDGQKIGGGLGTVL